MGNNEEELAVVLSLKDAFSQKILKPIQQMELLKTSFNTLSNSAKIASGIIAGSLALTARSIMHSADELVKLNTITGFSIEKLQKLGFAAELNSSSMGELAIGLKQLSRQALSASDGTGEAADTFKKLGVTVNDSNGKLRSAEAIFNDTVNALSKVKNNTEQTAIAMQLFGRSGQNLIPLIKEGTAGFDRFGKIAEELGIVIEGPTIEALESFGDQLTALKQIGKAFVAEGLLVIAENLPLIIEGFTDAVIAVNKYWHATKVVLGEIGAFGTLIKDAALAKGETFEEAGKSLSKVWQNYTRSVLQGEAEEKAAFQQKTTDIRNFAAKVQKAMADIKNGGAKTGAAEEGGVLTELARELKKTEAVLAEYENTLEKLQLIYKLTGDKAMYYTLQVKAASEAIEKHKAAATEDGKITKDEKEEYEQLARALKKATEDREKFNEATARGSEVGMENAEKLNEQFGLDATEEQLKRIIARANETGESMASIFKEWAEARDDQKKLEEDARGLAKSFDFAITEEQMANIVQYSKDTNQSLQEVFEQLAAARDSDPLAGLEMAIRDVAKETVNLRAHFGNLFRSMEGAFSNAFESMMTGGVKLKNILKNVFNDIKRSFIKMISDILAQQLMKQFAGMFFGGGGGVGAGMGASFGQNAGNTGNAATSFGGLAMSGASSLGSVAGISGGTIAMAGLGVGVAVGQQGIEEGNVGASAGGMALAGAALGTMIAPGIGTVVGAVLGAAYGAYAGNREKKKQEKAKKEAEAQAAEQQRLLDEQRQKAADLLETEMIGRYGGGLAEQSQAAAIGEIFSGDVTPADLDALGIKPQDVLAREGEINRMTEVNVDSPNINLNVGHINSAYDVRQVAQDLGYHFTQALQDAAASNP